MGIHVGKLTGKHGGITIDDFDFDAGESGSVDNNGKKFKNYSILHIGITDSQSRLHTGTIMISPDTVYHITSSAWVETDENNCLRGYKKIGGHPADHHGYNYTILPIYINKKYIV